MARKRSFALVIAFTAFAVLGASPITAQSSEETAQAHSGSVTTADKRPRQQTRVLNVPGYPSAYVVTTAPKDTRSPRQRCIDDEVDREGGSLSSLAMSSIDLKCSQR